MKSLDYGRDPPKRIDGSPFLFAILKILAAVIVVVILLFIGWRAPSWYADHQREAYLDSASPSPITSISIEGQRQHSLIIDAAACKFVDAELHKRQTTTDCGGIQYAATLHLQNGKFIRMDMTVARDSIFLMRPLDEMLRPDPGWNPPAYRIPLDRGVPSQLTKAVEYLTSPATGGSHAF